MHPDAAMTLSRAWAADSQLIGGMCSYDQDGAYLVQGQVLIDDDDEVTPTALPSRLTRAANCLVGVLAGHGYRVTGWDQVELTSDEVVAQRLHAVAMPDVVSVAEFAEKLGVTRQRVYQLESDRKAGRDNTGFPRPVLDGYWLRSQVETYRINRKTKPGPAPARSLEEAAAIVGGQRRRAIAATVAKISERIERGEWHGGTSKAAIATLLESTDGIDAVIAQLCESGHFVHGEDGKLHVRSAS
jgi:predicted DNA-binding transcriptional regulator AlpA